MRGRAMSHNNYASFFTLFLKSSTDSSISYGSYSPYADGLLIVTNCTPLPEISLFNSLNILLNSFYINTCEASYLSACHNKYSSVFLPGNADGLTENTNVPLYIHHHSLCPVTYQQFLSCLYCPDLTSHHNYHKALPLFVCFYQKSNC